MLDTLILADRTIEHHALLGVGGRAAQRIAADADRLGADQDAFRVEAVEDVAEALPLLADPILVGMKSPSMKIAFESTALRPILGIRWTSILLRSRSV
jgi:hypothetical protein